MKTIIACYVAAAFTLVGVLFGGIAAQIVCGLLTAYYLWAAYKIEKTDKEVQQAVDEMANTIGEQMLK